MSNVHPEPIGPYTPKRLIATGAQARVWLAEGPDGEVALKVAQGEGHRQALAREVQVLRRCSHPHLVKLIDAAKDDRWIAVERIEGLPLHLWAPKATQGEILDVGIQIAGALEHLHEQQVIHGDMKPSNVVVDAAGRATLIDLGIATLASDESKGFKGTLGYAAPELLQGARPTALTDIYGLGATLYASLTGDPPFQAPDPAALTYLPLVTLPAPPASLNGELSELLDHLLLTMLVRDPSKRISSLARVVHMLERAKTAPRGKPVLGMRKERDTLRKAVVGVCDSEARVVVVYGPPGCGRRTLLGEAVDAARRQGVPYLKGVDARNALKHIRGAKAPTVMVLPESAPRVVALANKILEDSIPCLLLVLANHPIPTLTGAGAIQITPSPLGEDDAIRLVEDHGGDPNLARTWWRESMGMPINILGRVRAWRRSKGMSNTSEIPDTSRRILAALQKLRHPISIADLARSLEMGQHALLDHCEVLFAEGLLQTSENGEQISIHHAP